jgi:hypothetical protein
MLHDDHACLLTELTRVEGLCPTKSGCVTCAHVEYVYFVGVLCRSAVRRMSAEGCCLSYEQQGASAHSGT